MKRKITVKEWVLDTILELNFILISVIIVSRFTIFEVPAIILLVVDGISYIVGWILIIHNKRLG